MLNSLRVEPTRLVQTQTDLTIRRAYAAIHRARDRDAVLDSALTALLDLVGGEIGGALLIDPRAQTLQWQCVRGADAALIAELQQLTLDPRLYELSRTLDPDSVLTTLTHWVNEILRARAITATLLMPLATPERADGLLMIASTTALDALEQADVSEFAEQVVIAIENAERAIERAREIEIIADALHQRQQELDGLARLSVELAASQDSGAISDLTIEMAKKLLSAPAAQIRLLDPRAPRKQLEDEIQFVLHERIPFGVHDLEMASAISLDTRARWRGLGWRAALVVPLLARDQMIGALTIADFNARAWTQRETDLLQTIANQAANAIHTAELFQDILTEQRKIQAILDSGVSGLYALDKDGRFVLFNRAAERITGWTLAQVVGKTWQETLSRAKKNSAPPLILQALEGGKAVRVLEGRELFTRAGNAIPVAETVAPLTDNHGHVTGAVGAFWDLSREKQAERTREFFLRMVAHELRTPITKILSAASLVNHAKLSRVRRAEMWLVVENAARGLKQLADQFLDVEGDAQTPRPVQIEKIALIKFMRELVNERRGLDRAHRYRVRAGTAETFAFADRNRWEHVARNLLDNAAKYSPPKSLITVAVKPIAADQVQVDVEDQGAGIPKAERELVFKAFYRSKNVKGVHGHGMGLAIVKEMLRDMGGTIGVAEKKSRGTILRVTLRRAR
ncbi:MAG: PAS domain S-box protein [Chloroflexi bacterium]|nr:PAS domain S-box protein [Chloroflexota bacterium]